MIHNEQPCCDHVQYHNRHDHHHHHLDYFKHHHRHHQHHHPPSPFAQASYANIGIAIDAVKASAAPHSFLSVSKQGVAGIVETTGNRDCHAVLPIGGGAQEKSACELLLSAGLPQRVMIDCGAGEAQINPDIQVACDPFTLN